MRKTILACALALPFSAVAADSILCDGDELSGGIIANIEVTDNGCFFDGASVTGNVSGGNVTLNDASVSGNLRVSGTDAMLSLNNGHVGGNFSLQGDTSAALYIDVGSSAQRNGSVAAPTATVVVTTGTLIAGNLRCTADELDASIAPGSVGGNNHCQSTE